MYDPGMEYLRKPRKNWLNETLSFIYALRRVVDASPQGVIEEKYLIHFRRLDFVFLKGLVRLLAAKSIEAEDIDDLSQWLANLGSPTGEILEMATDLGSAVGKELTELLRRQFVARFIRASRPQGCAVLSLESAITAGLIADGEGFLLQGIAEIKSIEGTRSRLAFLRDTARENSRRKQLRQFAEQAERTAVHSEARSA